MPGREPAADLLADHRRAPLSAAHQHFESGLAARVAVHAQADVVHRHRGPVPRRAGHRDLELARQVRELGVQHRVLPDQLAVGARVHHFVPRPSRVRVGGDVAHAVPRGLHRVHLHLRQLLEEVGRLLQLDPVELHVLPRGDVTEAPVVTPGDVGELAHLARGQDAVGHVDPQHVGVELQIEAVHQTQGFELVLVQLAAEPAPDLAAELPDALGDQPVIELVVAVHAQAPRAR